MMGDCEAGVEGVRRGCDFVFWRSREIDPPAFSLSLPRAAPVRPNGGGLAREARIIYPKFPRPDFFSPYNHTIVWSIIDILFERFLTFRSRPFHWAQ